MANALTVYCPDPSVVAVTTRPVPASVIVTVALGSTAPVESVIVPVTRAVSVWADAIAVRHATRISAAKNLVIMFPPIRRWRGIILSGTGILRISHFSLVQFRRNKPIAKNLGTGPHGYTKSRMK